MGAFKKILSQPIYSILGIENIPRAFTTTIWSWDEVIDISSSLNKYGLPKGRTALFWMDLYQNRQLIPPGDPMGTAARGVEDVLTSHCFMLSWHAQSF